MPLCALEAASAHCGSSAFILLKNTGSTILRSELSSILGSPVLHSMTLLLGMLDIFFSLIHY
jgi:hypothetical protein